MISSLVFMKKCKKLIVDEDLSQSISNIEGIFYDFLKEFERKALEDAFSYYADTFDFENNNIYEFINSFGPMIDFLCLENIDFDFNKDEKQLLLIIFDSTAENINLDRLNELASALIKIGALN